MQQSSGVLGPGIRGSLWQRKPESGSPPFVVRTALCEAVGQRGEPGRNLAKPWQQRAPICCGYVDLVRANVAATLGESSVRLMRWSHPKSREGPVLTRSLRRRGEFLHVEMRPCYNHCAAPLRLRVRLHCRRRCRGQNHNVNPSVATVESEKWRRWSVQGGIG